MGLCFVRDLLWALGLPALQGAGQHGFLPVQKALRKGSSWRPLWVSGVLQSWVSGAGQRLRRKHSRPFLAGALLLGCVIGVDCLAVLSGNRGWGVEVRKPSFYCHDAGEMGSYDPS